jgi:fibronectin-binding autotransporter adhesin
MLVRDFHFASDAPADALSDINALSSLTLPSGMSAYIALDSSIEGATFNIPVLTLGEGADVGVTNSASDATLIIAQATLAGGATFDVGPSARCAAAAAAGIGPLAKTGAGTLALTGSAAYTGDTVLCAGTLALDAAYLPTSTDLSVTTGATLNLGFSGTQHIHALFVDGIQMPGGRYSSSNTTWITGDGVLVVMYPPIGTLFFMK